MALKFFYIEFPGVAGNLTLFKNNSNAFVLVIGVGAIVTGNQAAITVADENGNGVVDILRVSNISESLSVSGTNNFSTTASTTEGITSTSESVNESISGLNLIFNVVFRKTLIPPGWSISSNSQVIILGFQFIQADSLEELRGFL